jgi:hypothetical protein
MAQPLQAPSVSQHPRLPASAGEVKVVNPLRMSPVPIRLLGAVVALAFATSLGLPQASDAQGVPACEPSTEPALGFVGLPSRLLIGREQEFGVDDTFATDSSVPGSVSIRMVDRHGRAFFSGELGAEDRGSDLLFLRVDLGNRFVSVSASS